MTTMICSNGVVVSKNDVLVLKTKIVVLVSVLKSLGLILLFVSQ